MALEDIKNKILSDVKAEAGAILSQAREEAQKLKEDFEKRAEIERENILAKARKKAEQIDLQIMIPARLARKSALLKAKHEMLDKVFKDKPQKLREEKELEVVKILYGE